MGALKLGQRSCLWRFLSGLPWGRLGRAHRAGWGRGASDASVIGEDQTKPQPLEIRHSPVTRCRLHVGVSCPGQFSPLGGLLGFGPFLLAP